MATYHTIQIQHTLITEIDRLIQTGEYHSRAEYVSELIRNDMRARRTPLIPTREDIIQILESIPGEN